MQSCRQNHLLLLFAYCCEFEEATSTKRVHARLRMRRVVYALEYTSLCLDLPIRPLFVGFMFFVRKFPGWYVGGRVITITHYTHFKFLLSKFSQIMAKIIIMNVGIDKTFLKFKFSQEIINNGEKCG